MVARRAGRAGSRGLDSVKRSTEVDGETCVIVPLRVIEETDAKEVRREHAIAWGCAWSAELDRGLHRDADALEMAERRIELLLGEDDLSAAFRRVVGNTEEVRDRDQGVDPGAQAEFAPGFAVRRRP